MKIPINGRTGLYCLIGSPVGHSGSPKMYNFAFGHHGLDYSYMAFEIREDQVGDFLDAARLLNIRGFNVTMPCKHEVARQVDILSPAARIIGACNTVVNDKGIFTGHMTDGEGFVLNLKDHGESVEGKKIVLAGAGGAATAIFVECALKGAASIHVYNRSQKGISHMEDLIVKLKTEGLNCQLLALPLSDSQAFYQDIAEADIFINGTSVGMSPGDDRSIVEDMDCLHPGLVVADIVYNPLETKLLKDSMIKGVKKAIPGDGMLLWQGYCAYKLYTGLEMPVKEYKEYLKNS